MRKSTPQGYRPTRQQEWLLRAALLAGSDAVEAWERWSAEVDIDRLDIGSYRLLPLLYRNLQAQGITGAPMGRLKGLYRYTWSKNQTLIHQTGPVLLAFHQAGIDTLLLKGIALGEAYYRDWGARPMDDVDILVPLDRALQAMHIVRTAGWIPDVAEPDRLIPIWHGIGFKHTAGGAIDLHWHVFWECCGPGADADLWDAAVSARLGDEPTRALNPADLLLHVCVHGAGWNLVPPMRWVADAMKVLSSGAEIDWERFLSQAQRRRLAPRVRDALAYLRDLLGAPVPPTILERVAQVPVSYRDRLEYRMRLCPPSTAQQLLTHWFHYARLAEREAWLCRPLGFVQYLRQFWGLRHLWELPGYAVGTIVRRLRGQGSGAKPQ